MSRKNAVYTVNIDRMDTDGNGFTYTDDGVKIYAPGTVLGDRVRIRAQQVNERLAAAVSTEILTPSPFRREPQCPYFSDCGGCQLQHMTPEGQEYYKRNQIIYTLKHFGDIEVGNIDFIRADEAFRYRNKMIFPFSPEGDWGFYSEHSHNVIKLNDCLLGDDLNAKILNTVRDFFIAEKLPMYDEIPHTGVLRRVFTRTSSYNGEIMAVISVNAENIPHRERLVFMLRRLSPRITSIILNINTARTNLALGSKNVLLYGKETLTDTLCGLFFEISAHSFFQINHAQTELLYARVLEYAACGKEDTVMDIYCGIGTISLAVAKSAKRVIGVEKVSAAIKNARENAVRNKIDNAEFVCSTAASAVERLIASGERPDIVILDPPRKGSDEITLGAILCAEPKRIVYVSCNPRTLARDLRFLTAGGYTLAAVTGVDLFPQTVHVETVVLLCRKTPDDVIKVKLSLDELELTSAESKATYEKIKEYVMRNFGLKVSTLYIAQTKRKLGIAMGENYNMPKSIESTQPQCPPEKEAAIVKALEHFKMI